MISQQKRNYTVYIGMLVVIIAIAVIYYLRRGGEGQIFGQKDNTMETLTTDRLQDLIAQERDDVYVIDVRTPGEFHSGAIPGAINIPVDEIYESPMPTTDTSAKIVVYCLSGGRSAQAKRIIEEMGYTDVTNFGGIGNWYGPIEQPKR